MRIQTIQRSTLAAVLALAPAHLIAIASQAPNDHMQLSSTFKLQSTTQIPGKTLKAGMYSVVVLDHLADRTVLRVNDEKGKPEATFLALPNAHLVSATASGPIMWARGPRGSEAVRGFAFSGSAVEFVYPKDDAVAIAKVNTEKVLAIDPASEGRPVSSKLSDEDRRMVTLWTLSSTRVGPANDSQPAIQAERYQPPADSQYAQGLMTPPDALAKARSASSDNRSHRPTENQVAAVKRPPVLASLPHTASALPTVLLIGLLALSGAVCLRLLRVAVS